MCVENFFSLKLAGFYLREISLLTNKWLKVIQNNVNILLMENNSLLNYSEINHILLKWKLFMT